MEHETIRIDESAYRDLKDALKNNAEEIAFREAGTDHVIILKVKNDNKKSSKEKNIVEKWMEGIKDIIDNTDLSNHYDACAALESIQLYCDAIIISVTS